MLCTAASGVFLRARAESSSDMRIGRVLNCLFVYVRGSGRCRRVKTQTEGKPIIPDQRGVVGAGLDRSRRVPSRPANELWRMEAFLDILPASSRFSLDTP